MNLKNILMIEKNQVVYKQRYSRLFANSYCLPIIDRILNNIRRVMN